MNTILAEFNQSGFEFDRIVTDTFALPYSYDQIALQPNELAVASTLNLKLKKLYTNLLYLYGLCNIASFNVPTQYTGWIGVSGRNPNVSLYTSSVAAASSFATNSSFSKLTDSTYAISIPYNDKNNFVVAAKNALLLFALDKNNNVVFNKSQSIVDPLSGSLLFQNIVSMENDASEGLYVLDKTLNTLYLYDLRSTFSDDYVFSQTFFLKDSIGGRGDKYDLLKFNGPNNVVFTGTEVIVEDTGNKCFKVYDKNFNFLNLTVALTLFNEVPDGFTSLTYSPATNQIIGTAGTKLYYLDYRSDYTIVSAASYDYDAVLDSDEYFIDTHPCRYESNIIYQLTNKKLFKKWIYKPESNIGVYTYRSQFSSPLGSANLAQFKWFSTQSYNLSTDQISIYHYNPTLSSNFINVYTDELNLISLLKQLDFNIYNFDDIKIKEDEYVQSWVFNKSFKKLVYDMYLLTANIGYRFYEDIGEYNVPIFIRRGYNTFFLEIEEEDLQTVANLYINENFQTEVINRCLQKIYNYQSALLTNLIQNKKVYEDVIFSSRIAGGGGASVFDFINYTAGDEFLLIPEPTGPMLYGNDILVNQVGASPQDAVTITGTVPYIPGAGISITEET